MTRERGLDEKRLVAPGRSNELNTLVLNGSICLDWSCFRVAWATRIGGARTGGARIGGARTGSARIGGARIGGARTGGARIGGARV